MEKFGKRYNWFMNISRQIYKCTLHSGIDQKSPCTSSRLIEIISLRILCDAAQTPSTKTKIAQLKFLTDLSSTYCTAAEFPSQPPADKAITKIVQMAIDQKSLELRNQARSCIISLYNCSTPNVCSVSV